MACPSVVDSVSSLVRNSEVEEEEEGPSVPRPLTHPAYILAVFFVVYDAIHELRQLDSCLGVFCC